MDIKSVFSKKMPEGAVFVISVDLKGNPNGMVAGWNMKCSYNPPRFAVCLSKKGNTHKLIQESKEFVIAVPNKELEMEINYFGSVKGCEVNKFKVSNIKTKKSDKIKSPLLQDATINFECELYKEIDVGDHIMFVGNILKWHINNEKGILTYMGRDKEGNRRFEEFKND